MARVILVAFAALATPLFVQAEHRGIVVGGRGPVTAPAGHAPLRGVGVGAINHGFGNVVFPAGAPGTIPPIGPTFPQQLGATVRGGFIPGYHGVNRGPVVPAVLPLYVGGFGYSAPQPPTNITIVNAPPQVPAVIINQSYTPDRAQPVMRDYTRQSLPDPGDAGLKSYQAPIPDNPEPPRRADADRPTVYLIAFKDGLVYSALAYWVEGDTLHYITTSHSHNRASLSLVDEKLSEQLNRERRVEFRLPATK